MNDEMAAWIIVEIRETLEHLGMDLKSTPPMFYREAILSAVNGVAEAMCEWRGKPLQDSERVEAASIIKTRLARP